MKFVNSFSFHTRTNSLKVLITLQNIPSRSPYRFIVILLLTYILTSTGLRRQTQNTTSSAVYQIKKHEKDSWH